MPIVCFALYINLPVVAVRFHGIPSILGKLSAAPLLIPILYFLWHRQGIVVSRSLVWIAALLTVQFISALCSQYPKIAMDTVKTSVLEGLIIYVVLTNALRTRKTLQHSLRALMLAAMFMGGLSVLQQATGTHHRDFGGFAQVADGEGFHVQSGRGFVRQRRLSGPIGEQNRYAQIMLMLVPIGAFGMLAERERTWQAIACSAAALAALGCALTFSRGAAVGFGLTAIVSTLTGMTKPRHFGIACLLGFLVLVSVPQYRTRLAGLASAVGVFGVQTSDTEGPDGAVRGRATAMLAAARMWLDHPVIGVGPDLSQMFTRSYGMAGGLRALEGNRKAHCLYLEFAAETGIIGLGCFMMIAGSSISQLWRARQAVESADPQLSLMASGLMLALVAYLATGLFLHFSYIRYFWLVLAVADSAARIASQQFPRDSAKLSTRLAHGDAT